MKNSVKEVVKTVKAVKVEVKENKVDRRTFNPGRPKSKEAQKQDEFVYNLTNGKSFTVKGLEGTFKLSNGVSLYNNDEVVGSLLNEYPSKLKFITTTLIGNTVDYVIKYKDIVLK